MSSTDPIRSALTTTYIQDFLRIKANQLVRKPEFRRSSHADIAHDLVSSILKQVDNYDPARSAPNTFIMCVAKTAVAMLIRKRGRIKRAAGYQSASIDRTRLHSEDGETMLIETINEGDLRRRCGGDIHDGQRNAELSVDVALAIEGLTDRQQEIARRLSSGTEASIAREMNISRRQVRNEVIAIREHFQDMGLEEY